MALERINWFGNYVFTLATEANIRAMHKAADLVAKNTKENFTLQGSGMTIRGKWVPGASRKKTKSGKRHMAAAPGKPPAIDIGTLRVSIMAEIEKQPLNVIGRVGPDIEKIKERLAKRGAKAGTGTNVEYGYFLEVGTSKMQPRPFLRPALIRTRKKVVKIFKEANS